MNRKILHTPDGVRDLYGEECRRKRQLELKLHDVLNSFGYQDIETPTFEYFDVFGRETGTIPSAELYKFFDKEGNTLVLRPDFTPSIARAAARYFVDDEQPIRLCYSGSVFVNHSSYRGRLKESTQMGAELMMDASAQADAELIAMVITALRSAGLEEFTVSLGNVRYFQSLVHSSALPEETVAELQALIRNKNSFGVRKMLEQKAETGELPETKQELKEVLSALPSLFGGREVLDRAAALAGDCAEAGQAVLRLRQVFEILEEYGLSQYVSFDLGMMSNYMYYTGILFRAYTYGSGEAVVKGGRYDLLLRYFGKDAPAVGFVIVVDQLMNALSRQNTGSFSGNSILKILCSEKQRAAGIRKAGRIREQGEKAVLHILPSEEDVLKEAQRCMDAGAVSEAEEPGIKVLRMEVS